MTKTDADHFASTLASAGVKGIYGIVGNSVNGLPLMIAYTAVNDIVFRGTVRSTSQHY